MKKIISILVCTCMVVSMAFTAAAATRVPRTPSDSKEAPGSLNDLLNSLFGSSEESSDTLSTIISDALDSLKESLPEVIDSVKEAIPEIVSGLEEIGEFIPDQDSGDPGFLDHISDESGAEGLQSILDQISGITGSADTIISGVDNSGEHPDLISGIADQPAEEGGESSLNDLIGMLSGGVSGAAAPDAQTGSDEEQAPALVGGFTVCTDAQPLLTEEEQDIFDKAETTLAGGAYTPVAVLGTQVVAGTNYAYLCLGAPDEPEDLAKWYIVTLYKDLSGNVTTLSIRDIDLTDIQTMNSVYNPSFVGSWSTSEPDQPGVLPDDAQAAFDKATKEYVGVGYSPIALLGTQVVAGLNYKFLCFGTLVTKDPVTSVYVLDIYQDPQGECTITDAQLFDLTSYISYGEAEDDAATPADDAAAPADDAAAPADDAAGN